MFEETNISKKTNSGILRGIDEYKEENSTKFKEVERKKLIKDIKEGKFCKRI